jgi:hypothetical protein
VSARSRYDELHDIYGTIRTTKRGTRYERLAAVVFAALDANSVVIHDLKVIGEETEVKHQIDVHIERAGSPKRILVECKDYDISGQPVGLGIVRDFWGVVDDVHPDEAWIISCNDFTEDARRYAKRKNIKLATLRAFAASDWEDRVHTIVTQITISSPQVEKVALRVRTLTDADAAAFFEDIGNNGGIRIDVSNDPSRIYDGTCVRSISEIVIGLSKIPVLDEKQTEVVEGKECDGWISGNGTHRYPISAFSIAIPLERTSIELTLMAEQQAAKLLLLGEEGLDFVLWDTTLEAYTIDDAGRVHLAEGALQKRLISVVSPIVSKSEI